MMFLIFLYLFSFEIKAEKVQNIDIMSYNVENLFDTKHDKGKNDWAYLPKTFMGKNENCLKIKYKKYRKECLAINWTKDHLNLKIQQIKKVVMYKRTKVPSILVLSEVENDNVVRKLAKLLGYGRWIVSDGPDKRGIDLAILYNDSRKLKFIGKKEHLVLGKYFLKRPTRPILEVEFKYGDKNLTVFANHWPSLANPNIARLTAARLLRKRVKEVLKENPKQFVIATGDFNTIPTKGPHPFDNELLADGHFRDVHKEYMMKIDKKKSFKAKGTYFYKKGKKWNLLDRFFVSENFFDGKGVELDLGSYKILSHGFMTKKYKGRGEEIIPLRYNHKSINPSFAGFSDHFPIYIRIYSI